MSFSLGKVVFHYPKSSQILVIHSSEHFSRVYVSDESAATLLPCPLCSWTKAEGAASLGYTNIVTEGEGMVVEMESLKTAACKWHYLLCFLSQGMSHG